MDDDDEDVLNEKERFFILDSAFDLVHLMKPDGAISAIMGQARDDARDAVKLLVRADPFNGEVIRDLQWKVRRFDDLMGYVNAILEAGRIAHSDIPESEALHALRIIRGEEANEELDT